MSRLSTNVLRYGREEPLPECVELHAGPLTLVLEEGSIRYVRLGEREVLRRVYAGIRDRSWGTVAPRISDLEIQQESDSFRVSFNVENTEGEIDFAWRGLLTGEANGTVTFTMDGRARRTFTTARTGFCILHPIAECAGQPCTVEHTDGTREEGRFPLLISPHQPFADVRAISHEVAPGVRAEVRLEGDTFETEDQRNWTDASYKTYSRPLTQPTPYRLEAGEAVRQTVRISLRSAPPPARAHHEEATVTVGTQAPGRLPRLGLTRSAVPDEKQTARLAALGLAHLRAELRIGRPGWEGALRDACREADALGAQLELAVFPGRSAEEELRALRAAADEARPAVAAWLVFGRGRGLIAAARQVLGDYDPAAPVGGGSAGDFVELNRNRPERGSLGVAAYGMNPQVHQFDNTSMVESLDGQAWTIRTARDFLGDVPLALGPIVLSRSEDYRQASLFCAAWTVGSLRRMCEGRAWSATYYDTVGPRGVTAAGDGAVYPVYHVMADLADFAGAEAPTLGVGHPLLVDALAARKEGRTRLLLANMTNDPRTVTLSGVPAGAMLHLLDETNAERAMSDPEGFRAEPARTLGGERVELLPYAVARLDWEEGA